MFPGTPALKKQSAFNLKKKKKNSLRKERLPEEKEDGKDRDQIEQVNHKETETRKQNAKRLDQQTQYASR